MTDVTQILSRIESGDPTASEQLLPLVYDELRRLAAQRLVRKLPGPIGKKLVTISNQINTLHEAIEKQLSRQSSKPRKPSRRRSG
jgi:hypothetical protein